MAETKLIVQRIQELCTQKDISVNKMLTACNLSKSVVDNLKKGSIPSADKLKVIADYFHVSTDYLLTGSDRPQNSDVTFDEFTFAMYNETKEMSEQNKQMLLDMAKMMKEREIKEGKRRPDDK